MKNQKLVFTPVEFLEDGDKNCYSISERYACFCLVEAVEPELSRIMIALDDLDAPYGTHVTIDFDIELVGYANTKKEARENMAWLKRLVKEHLESK